MMFKAFFFGAVVFASSAQADLDPCMVGNWQADTNDIALMITRQLGRDANVQSGEVQLNIAADGSYRLDAITLQVAVDGDLITISGRATGNFSFVDQTWFSTIDDNQLHSNAQGDLAGRHFLGRALGSYYCSGNALRLESEPGFGPTNLPRAWARNG